MRANDYQHLAMRTCSIPSEDKVSMLNHAVFGLASEAGEVAGILQKEYQGHEFDENHAIRELGDLLWFVAEACDAMGTTMGNGADTHKKLPQGWQYCRRCEFCVDVVPDEMGHYGRCSERYDCGSEWRAANMSISKSFVTESDK